MYFLILKNSLLSKKIVLKIIKKISNSFKIFPGTLMDKYAVIKAEGYEVVIHLAAILGVKRTEDNKLQCLNVNVNGTENILNACLQNENTHFLFGSSSEVYGEPISILSMKNVLLRERPFMPYQN